MTYEFRCDNCQHNFSLQREMGKTGPAICPLCGKAAAKLFTSPAIVINWFDSDSYHESKRFRPSVSHRSQRSLQL